MKIIRKKWEKGFNIVLICSAFVACCSSCSSSSNSDISCSFGTVSINKTLNYGSNYYYDINIDMTSGTSSNQIGQDYGTCIKRLYPSFVNLAGTYVNEMLVAEGFDSETIITRIADIKANMEQQYIDEVDGLITALSDSTVDPEPWWVITSVDDILWLYNLLPDVMRTSKCTVLAAWGDSAENGKTIVHRNFDWFTGLTDEVLPIGGITKFNYEAKKLVSISGLGDLGCISCINTSTRVFGALLDSQVEGTTYESEGARSYYFDLRTAVDNESSAVAVANYLMDAGRTYAVSHLILAVDEDIAVILENNMVTLPGSEYRRAIRYDTSELQEVTWDHPEMIASVNSFLLNGQPDNFSESLSNTKRWELLTNKMAEKTIPYSMSDIRDIMTSYWGSKPGPFDEGDIYNTFTAQMMEYVPADNMLYLFTRGELSWPLQNELTFKTISLE